MRQRLYYSFVALMMLVTVAACKGTSKAGADSADSGQNHISTSSPADSNKYPTSPNETGGQDTSGNGIGGTQDSVKTTPK